MLYSIFFLFFLFSFFLSFFPQKSVLTLLPAGNKRNQIETLTQCVEWSQFVVDCFFSNVTFFIWVLGNRTFLTRRTNAVTQAMTTQPTRLQFLRALMCGFFGARIPATLTQTEFLSLETLDSSYRYAAYCKSAECPHGYTSWLDACWLV